MMRSGQYTTISRLKQQSCFRLLNRPGETSLGQPPSEANMRLLLRHERWRGLRSRMRWHAAATAAPASHDELPASSGAKPEVLRHRGVVIGKVNFVVVGDAHGVCAVAVPIPEDELPRGAGAKPEVLRYGLIVIGQIDFVIIHNAHGVSPVAIPVAKDQLPGCARAEPEMGINAGIVVALKNFVVAVYA